MLLLTSIAVISLLAGAGAYVWSRRSAMAANVLVPLLLALVCGKAVLDAKPAWEWTLFPWPGYAFVQGSVLYGIAVVFFGVAAVRLPLRWNRLVVLALGVAVLGHGLHRHAWLAWPEVHGDGRVPGVDHHLVQSTHYTCGPAACAAALSHLGIVVSERDMAAMCLTRSSGSRLFDLYRGLVVALDGRAIDVSIEDLPAEALLASDLVVVAANSGFGHALCLVTTNGAATVHDPLQPYAQRWDGAEVRREYRGPAIVLRGRDVVATPVR